MSQLRQILIPETVDLAVAKTREQRHALALAQAFELRNSPFGDERSNTFKAYARAWRAWVEWCGYAGIDPRPAIDPIHVTEHLQYLTVSGAAPNTVRLALTAISSYDAYARIQPTDPTPLSVRKMGPVQVWLKQWSKKNPKAPRKKAPSISPRELHRVLELAQSGPGKGQAKYAYMARWLRDRCLLLVGVYGALRVSEVVGLVLSDAALNERGLQITLRNSKTDQEGRGTYKPLMAQADLGVCPVEAWRAWLAVRGAHEGPVFVQILRDGTLGSAPLATRSANRIVQRLAQRAGLELVTSHSMRATFITIGVNKNIPLPVLAIHTDHTNLNTLAGYARRATLFDKFNPTIGLLDDNGDRFE